MSAEESLFAARNDVSVEQVGDKFIVNDPVKHTFIQLGVAEYIVFRCFDGKSTTQDIADRLKAERNVIVSSAHVARLRDRLHEKQVVLAPGEVVLADDVAVTGSAGGVAGLVMIDLKLAFNPDLFLTRLFHRIKYVVFRPAFFVALLAVVGLAITVWLRSWDAIRLQAGTLDAGGSFLLYYACLSGSILAHEVAHGVVTKGFGGKVPRMGAFLYFFLAVFYTDVSSSWMFRSKFRRLMVLFAGALANVAICAVSTLVWRSTLQGSPINQVCFALMMINAVAASFTLFPLLRGDGYYILSTALDIPNLRQNAYRYTGALLRRALIDRTATLPKATHRESLIYVCYAPIQVLFFAGFFGYVVYRTAGWLIEELHFLGFWIIVVVLVDRLGRPVLRIVPGTLRLLAEALRLGLRQGVGALVILLARPLIDAARWVVRMWRVELVIAAAIATLALVPYRLHISAPFEVISAGPVTVRAKTGGLVDEYLVSTGDWVKAGEVVAVLIDQDLASRREVVAAELDGARARLAELEAGYRSEEVKQASIGARGEARESALTRAELRRVRRLHALGISSRKELDEATSVYRAAVARTRGARAELRMLDGGFRVEELERQRAEVARAEHELAAVEQRLEWTKVRSVVDGHVVTPPYELAQRLGKHVAPGDALVEIVDPSQLIARVSVPERFMSDAAPGMPVTLRFYKDPDVEHGARLDAIEPSVTLREHQATGALGMLSTIGHLKTTAVFGATGIAKIDAGSQSVLGLLLRRTHRAAWVVFWSWW